MKYIIWDGKIDVFGGSRDCKIAVWVDRDGVKCESGWSDFYGSIKFKTVQLYDPKKPSKFAKQNGMIICFVIVKT